MPDSPRNWLEEIAAAYKDATGAIPSGALVGQDIRPEGLFHVAPSIRMESRGVGSDERLRRKATEAALSSYIATKKQSPDAFSSPQVTFAIAGHPPSRSL